LQQNLDSILKSEEGSKFLLGLPFSYMKSICQSNKLCISDEKQLVGLFEKYLAHRESLPLLKEEDPANDWTHLTEEEKEGRKKAQEEKETAEKAAKDEEEKQKEADYNALDDLGKANADWAKKVEVVHKECTERLKLCRLSKAQKIELFSTIRYSFMKHEDLIALTMNKAFDLAKDYVLEGLSVRLNSFENGIKKELKINTEPRVNYEDPKGGKASASGQNQNAKGGAAGAPAQGVPSSLKKTNFENYYERKLHDERQGHAEFEQKMVGAAIGHNIKNLMSNTMKGNSN